MITPDPALDRCPAAPFPPRDAARFGLSRTDVLRLVAAGALRRPLTGVLVRADVPDSVEVRAAAAGLVLPKGAALGRTTAAWLDGVDCRPPGEHLTVPPVDCVVPTGTQPLRRPGVRCFVADLTDEDLRDVHGLTVTTPARTAVDLARYSLPGYGLGALDAMTRAGLVDPVRLAHLVERWRGGRYVDRARQLIALVDPLAESFGESCLRLRVVEAGFPTPQLQIPVVDADGVLHYRLDLGWEARRYAVEYDGEEFHAGDAELRHDQRRREDLLVRWGWTVAGVGKALVLGPSMRLELALAEVFSQEPAIRRRAW